jgi:cytochrome o ubiquinol oxidase subunit IV
MSTATSYGIGFALSIVLTLAAFGLVELHTYTPQAMRTAFVALALLQLFVQLVFFLHVGRGNNTRWRVLSLAFALFVVVVLVGGSLWIMDNIQHTSMDMGRTPFIEGVITPQYEND